MCREPFLGYIEFMICLKDIGEDHLENIAYAFAEAFTAEEGTVYRSMDMYAAQQYFLIMLRQYSKTGLLYALSENEEGYCVYHRKNSGLPWYRDMLLTWHFLTRLPMQALQKMIIARHGWQDYTISHAHDADYIDVSLVMVRREYQGQGYLRKLLQEPFRLADELGIPVILDTDSEVKAAKYEHVGMHADKDLILESGVHMFTMIYSPES